MRKVTITCPSCLGTSRLFLTSRPHLLILNCPFCHRPLLNNKGKTYEIDGLEIIRMKGSQIENFLSQSPRQNLSPGSAVNPLPESAHQDVSTHSSHRKKEPARSSPLSENDLINLKIALECCRDVSDFLKMI